MADNSFQCTCGSKVHRESSSAQCPKCGRTIINAEVTDGIVLHECLETKMKKPGSKHKHSAYYESEQGVAKGGNGKLIFKKKIRDRENAETLGSYSEYVRDKDGNIIVNKIEKLSEHTSLK